MVITKEVEVEIDVDEVIEDTSTKELIEIIQDRLEDKEERRDLMDEFLSDTLGQTEGIKFCLERIVSIRTKRYIDRKVAKEIINEMIDDAFPEF